MPEAEPSPVPDEQRKLFFTLATRSLAERVPRGRGKSLESEILDSGPYFNLYCQYELEQNL
jgi:hypothetical protein